MHDGRLIPFKWELVAWLFLTYFLYYGDRALYGVVLADIGTSLDLSDSSLGLVNTLMFVGIAGLMPFAGYAGDNWNRKWVIVFSLTAWSLGTVLTGAATGLIGLIVTRSVLTGCGESFYSPSAYSLLGEHHVESRARAMALHQAALYVGVIASGALGAWCAARIGWRSSFLIFGGAGLLIAVGLAVRLRGEVRRSGNGSGLERTLTAALFLWRNPLARMYCVAFAVLVCFVNSYITWAPKLLISRYGVSTGEAGFNAMFWHHLAALAAVVAGGYLSDRWSRKRREARLQMMIISMAASAPLLIWLGLAGSTLSAYLAMAVLGCSRGAYECNLNASLFDVIPAETRAVAVSVFNTLAFAVGAFAPWIFGMLASAMGTADGLAFGFRFISILMFGAAGLLYWGGRKHQW